MKNLWLIDKDELGKIEAAEQSYLKALASNPVVDTYARGKYLLDNKTATISIEGPLTAGPNRAMDFFGVKYTAYTDVNNAIDAPVKAKGDSLDFEITSPGGQVLGLMPLMDKIAATEAKTRGIIRGMATSAAYMLATQMDTIESTHESDIIGSVGVVASYVVDKNVVSVTNTDSNKKAPDLSTDEGQKVVQAYLDGQYNMLVSRIASGRDTTEKEIKERYGQGSVMTAREALAAGMIDVIDSNVNNVQPGDPETTTKGFFMDLEKLKADFPELYAQCVAMGKNAESKRVQAHLKLAEASGDTAKAIDDINAGEPCDSLAIAHHSAEGIKRARLEAKAQDTAATDVEATATQPMEAANESVQTEEEKLQAEIAAELNAMDGVEVSYGDA